MKAIIGGVDTHSAVHCVAAVDSMGRLLGVAGVPAVGGRLWAALRTGCVARALSSKWG